MRVRPWIVALEPQTNVLAGSRSTCSFWVYSETRCDGSDDRR
ncbi:hypothetical protein [Embleya sp. AB8]